MRRPEQVAGITLAIVLLGWIVWRAATWEPSPPPPPDGYFIPPEATINFGPHHFGLEEASWSLIQLCIALAGLSLLAGLVAMALKDPGTARVCSMPPLLVGAGMLALVLVDAATGERELTLLFYAITAFLLGAAFGLRRWAEARLSQERQLAFAQSRMARSQLEVSPETEATASERPRVVSQLVVEMRGPA